MECLIKAATITHDVRMWIGHGVFIVSMEGRVKVGVQCWPSLSVEENCETSVPMV